MRPSLLPLPNAAVPLPARAALPLPARAAAVAPSAPRFRYRRAARFQV